MLLWCALCSLCFVDLLVFKSLSNAIVVRLMWVAFVTELPDKSYYMRLLFTSLMAIIHIMI